LNYQLCYAGRQANVSKSAWFPAVFVIASARLGHDLSPSVTAVAHFAPKCRRVPRRFVAVFLRL